MLRTVFIFPRQCTYIVFILQCLIVKKTTGKLSKKSRNRHRSKRFRRPRLYCKFLGKNQVPDKLYLGQNLKQYVMKEAVIYKILRYRQNRCRTKNTTSPTVSVRIHRRITRQHPRLHQNPHHKNSTPNISTRCKRNSYITSIPIDCVLPKLLNYLAFQSFDFELPDEGYSRNVHVH